MRRRHWIALSLAVVLVAAGLAWIKHRDSARVKPVVNESAESDFVARLNAERSASGLSTLAVDGELTAITRRWSERMSNEDVLYHNPNLKREVSQPWKRLAENVGYGANTGEVHGAFMSSPGHKANILDSGMDRVGVGAVVNDAGRLWVTEVFKQTGQVAPRTTAIGSATTIVATTRPPRSTVTTAPCVRR